MPVTNSNVAGAPETYRMMQLVRTAHVAIDKHETAMCRDGRPDVDRLRRLAGTLSYVVDVVQTALVGHAHHDDWSHRTALEAVRIALYDEPIPWDTSVEDQRAWRDRLADRAVDLATIAVDLVRDARQDRNSVRRVA